MIEWASGYGVIAIPLVLFVLFATFEYLQPRRKLALGRYPRWITHLLFFLTNAVVGRLLTFFIVVATAANWAEQNQFGLLYLVAWPWWTKALLAFVILDFAVWFQHVLLHRIPLFWRAHKVHHSDRDLDVTTALRFHPFELIISTLYKSIWVILLGVPLPVALAFELWLNGNAMFNHSNINLPRWLDRLIRPIIVTPDMHLVHHSIDRSEQNHNYGFALTIWDRLAGTYLRQSKMGKEKQPIGLSDAQDSRPGKFLWAMAQPVREYPDSSSLT